MGSIPTSKVHWLILLDTIFISAIGARSAVRAKYTVEAISGNSDTIGAIHWMKTKLGIPARTCSDPRADARLKVTGAAQYPADFPLSNPAFGVLVTSPIAKGQVTQFDLTDAHAVDGVLDILTFENTAELRDAKFGEGSSTSIQKLGPEIFHAGQIVALVVADSYEAGREAAHRVVAAYAAEAPSATFGDAGLVERDAPKKSPQHRDLPRTGDAEAALAGAEVVVEADTRRPRSITTRWSYFPRPAPGRAAELAVVDQVSSSIGSRTEWLCGSASTATKCGW